MSDSLPPISFEPEFESWPRSESLQKLGHQLLEMGVHDLAREYFQMAKQTHPVLGYLLLEKAATQLHLDFLNEGPSNDKTIHGL
jgi:hypothetical protein